ncbi:MAG: hypothetical protein P4L90_19525, partial [Rhodopila sp.]|nr:hypothetical protein [Rhodopila sp.]
MAESPLRGSQRPAEPRPERRLAAILAADIDLYPITVHDDEAHRRVTQEMNWLREAVIQASGTIFTFAGVGLMAEFTSATEALKCALRFQANLARRKTDETEPTRFRMAVNAGEILAGNRHIGRAAMNLAARLERIAPPGGIALPVALHDQLRHVVSVPVTPLDQRDPPDMTQAFAVSISAEACLLWADHPATRKRAPSRPIADSRASLAVIPFGADGGREQLAAAVADDVVHALGGLTTWLAVTRTQAAKIRTPIDLHRLRQTSSARYILHGSAEAEREMLRLTVELNEVETGRVLWSDRFDRLLDAQAALREDAATRIACAIPSLVFQRELDRSALARPDTLTAHDLALRAFSAIMLPERDAFAAAGGLLRQAEQRAGPHGSTWFAATWWHLMAISQGWSADPAADAREAIEGAARMDRNDPVTMALLAYLQSAVHRDHELASAMLDRVIDTA